MSTQTLSNARSDRQRGMSLIELIIAVAIFTVILISALAIYDQTQRAYMNTESATTQQQNTRLAFDRMVNTLRDAGANVNPDGLTRRVDEQIEGAWDAAVFVRGDRDTQREPDRQAAGAHAFRIVTTDNDEIVGFVVTKPTTAATCVSGPGCAEIRLDLMDAGGGGSATDKRDAGPGTAPATVREEDVSISAATLTVAGQDDPPYRLERVSFDAAGNITREVMAENVFRVAFTYFDANGALIDPATLGGADAERVNRARIRRIGVQVIGMNDRADARYTDVNTYAPVSPATTPAAPPPAALTSAIHYRKVIMTEEVEAASLGRKGSLHGPVPALVLAAPGWINACQGHCDRIVLNWAPIAGATNYRVRINAPAVTGPPAFPAIVNSTRDVITNTETVRVPLAGGRNYTFEVAAYDAGTGTVGAWSAAVTQRVNHITASNTPAGVSGPAISQSGNALLLTWPAVTQNTQALSNTCAVAGGGPTSLDNPTELIDGRSYEIYRVRSSGPGSGIPDFSIAGTRIDNVLPNTSPGMTTSFTDRSASPCQGYYYKVLVMDECDVPGASSPAMSSPASYTTTETPNAPAGIDSNSTGVAGDATTPHQITLRWNPVTTTTAGNTVHITHYRIYRESRPESVPISGFSANGTIEVYDANMYVDSPPAVSGGENMYYRYRVTALFDCPSPIESAVLSTCGPASDERCAYSFPCATSGGVTIQSPTHGAQFSTDTVPITVRVTGAWNGARIQIRAASGGVVLPWTTQTANVTDGDYTFSWDASAAPDNANYYIDAAGIQGSCVRNAGSIMIELVSVPDCLRLVTDSQSPKFVNSNKSVEFKVTNACAFAVTFNAMTPSWAGGPNPTSPLKKIKYDGNDLYDPGAGVGSGTLMVFNRGAAQVTVNAAGTSLKIHMEFEHEMYASLANRARLNPLNLRISSPAPVRNDDIGPVNATP